MYSKDQKIENSGRDIGQRGNVTGSGERERGWVQDAQRCETGTYRSPFELADV